MTAKTYQPGEPYTYPLLLKKRFTTPLIYSPDREIVYRDRHRIIYRTLNERIQRLANALADFGVKAGDVVAVFEFDSRRYLECFMAGFAEQGPLPRYAVPERFEFVDAIPKTSVGKLDKKVLRQTHAGRCADELFQLTARIPGLFSLIAGFIRRGHDEDCGRHSQQQETGHGDGAA
jgi:acyl-CoA synthetase (AMP-forming)/AMP-acid ligase II